ncbi:MAG: hypothetical protein F6K17_19890 [Okeania sp. SIO3C4]|nr:hypothetical protein [Okeania sp. SIO3C4]
MTLSEYFRRQCYIAVDPSETYISQIIEFIDSNNLIFGSDYPDKVIAEVLIADG